MLNKVSLSDKSGSVHSIIRLIRYLYGVLSFGVKTDQTLADALVNHFDRVVKIGDTAPIGRIANAVETGFVAAYQLV